MKLAESFWWLLTVSSVAWYVTVTVYVAIRGAFDIRGMLRRLAAQQDAEQPPPPAKV
jgi:hypothetical protein